MGTAHAFGLSGEEALTRVRSELPKTTASSEFAEALGRLSPGN
ncbi:MAG: hypothetical protein ACLQK4_07880 [Acidimicrobiales bacterium]